VIPGDASRDPGVDAAGGAADRQADEAWPRQFAVLLAEALAGIRPVGQLRPWLSERAGVQVQRLLPLFGTARQLRVLRVITTHPARYVIEMTVVVDLGPRRRALAIRLEQGTTAAQAPSWRCTAVEAALST
jgi:hypothetical protein